MSLQLIGDGASGIAGLQTSSRHTAPGPSVWNARCDHSGDFPMNLCRQWIHGFERRRLPDRVSLGVVDTDFTQGLEDLVALDKSGDGTLAHHPGNVSDGFNHGPVHLAVEHFRYEASVYLDVVDG